MQDSELRALIHLTPLVSESAEAGHPQDARETWIEEFLAARSFATNTHRAYQRDLRRFLEWSSLDWPALTASEIAAFKQHLLGQGLGAASVNRALASLSSFLKWLALAHPNRVSYNPIAGISQERLPPTEPKDLSPDEVKCLFQAIQQRGLTYLRDLAIVTLLSHGLRLSEVAALNVSDLDTCGDRVVIRQAKMGSTGTVPLSPSAQKVLAEYLEERSRRTVPGDVQPLFLAQNRQQRLGRQGIYYLIKELGEAAGIADMHPHRLRHTYATMLLLSGMDSLNARTLTRHKSESSFKRYTKRVLELAAEREFKDKVGEFLPLGDKDTLS